MPSIQRLAFLSMLVAAYHTTSCSAAQNEVVNVDVYVTVPKDTDLKEPIYLAGNLPQVGNWQAAGVRLKKVNGGNVYHAQLRLPRGSALEYKITRGSWETVEKGGSGEELANRTLKVNGDVVERITVARWRTAQMSATQPKQVSTITGEVRVHDVDSSILRNRRKVLVWLPPGYDKESDHRYPVLYMHDGQNVFDAATSFAGEWHADEIADRLIRDGKIDPIIIVAIENNWMRSLEYTPGSRTSPGRAQQYGRFIVEEVKPLIDRTYRTQSDREHTAIGGSSLGGLVSLFMLREYPTVFGACAAVSPSLWWDDKRFIDDTRADPAWARGKRIWLDMGTAEAHDDTDKSKLRVSEVADFARLLEDSGLRPGKDLVWMPVEGADHSESAWSARFDRILTFLYGK